MSEPKDKSPKAAPRDKKPAAQRFDPYWNGRSGTVASESEYVQNATREPSGWHRGARIRKP